MSAAHFKLGNLTGILDYNGLQGEGAIKEKMNLEPLADKWRAFGWRVMEADGHDFEQLESVFHQAKRDPVKPTYIIAHTVKGKGVSFMENVASWHGSRVPDKKELAAALAELQGTSAGNKS